jgi:Cu/Ag efflux protein CusF
MPEVLKSDSEAQKLRQSLHEKIDRLPLSKLAAADRVLLQMEVEELREGLDLAFDQDRAESKLTPEKVGEAIALHRARHPYAG